MNCEEYRQAIAADPSFEDDGAHVAECAGCEAYRNDMQALDRTIRRALELDVPDFRVPDFDGQDDGNVTPLVTRRRFGTPAWVALAATVLIAAFVGLRLGGGSDTDLTLAEMILAHVEHEPGAVREGNEPVSDARLARVIPSNVASMDRNTGLFTYAQSCVINGHRVPHLVMQGERGPVTIILLPDEMIDGAIAIEGETVNGVILPVGDGSIAIIGDKEESLERIEESVVNSVTWST